MQPLSHDTPLGRTEQNVFTKLEGEAVLLQLSSGKYFSLNGVGTFLWDQLEEPKTASELAGALVVEYQVEHEQALSDTLKLLGQLIDAGFLVAVGAKT
jgi:hypothetical protein